MKGLLIWTLVALCGLGLIFDGSIRNDYYTAFSYLFPTNTKYNQDLADTTRLVLGLAMTLSIFNVFGGLLLKVISIIGFVIYSVAIHQDLLLNPQTTKLKQIASVATHITLLFVCMDSIINQIISQQTKSQKERTRRAIEAAKKKVQTAPQQEKQKTQKPNSNPISGKTKNHQEAKHNKKGQKSGQHEKKH